MAGQDMTHLQYWKRFFFVVNKAAQNFAIKNLTLSIFSESKGYSWILDKCLGLQKTN